MAWSNELVRVYELLMKSDLEPENKPLPPYHSTAQAQITIQIDENGNFLSAEKVDKKEAFTIIPATESSATRSIGAVPHPLTDQIGYIAGDYSKYCNKEKTEKNHKKPNCKYDKEEYREKYLRQLQEWAEGSFSHPSIKAVYEYVKKGTVMADLINSGVIQLEKSTGRVGEEIKIDGKTQDEVTVRFIVGAKKTWEDVNVYNSFIKHIESKAEKVQLCYATGEVVPITEKHSSKILTEGSKAKLISSNDKNGFTYRGRFNNANEAVSIGYEFSEKMHNALKWLIRNQGVSFREGKPYRISRKYGALKVLIWKDSMGYIAEPTCAINEYGEEEEETKYNPGTVFKEKLKKKIFGANKDNIDPNEKVIIMALDAVDEKQGRISIVEYNEMSTSEYNENIQKWHDGIAWEQYNPVKSRYEINSFSVYDIATCAYGIEKKNSDGTAKIECKDGVMKSTITRLLKCIIWGKRIPVDIVDAIVEKAKNPQNYDTNGYNFNKVLAVACGLVQKYNIDHNKGGMQYMGYNKNNTNRSYLFGCLLAIADHAERASYTSEEKKIRITNAKRQWRDFSKKPADNWNRLEIKLQPYLKKLKGKKERYANWIDEIMNKFADGDFSNKRLSSDFLLGYYHFNRYITIINNKDDNKNNEKNMEG